MRETIKVCSNEYFSCLKLYSFLKVATHEYIQNTTLSNLKKTKHDFIKKRV